MGFTNNVKKKQNDASINAVKEEIKQFHEDHEIKTIELQDRENEQKKAADASELERTQKEELEAERPFLTAEIKEAQKVLLDHRSQLAESKKAAELVRLECEGLVRFLTEEAKAISEQHKSVAQEVGTSCRGAILRLSNQNQLRQRCQEAHNRHENLQKQVNEGEVQHERAKVMRDASEGKVIVLRKQQADIQRAHAQLRTETNVVQDNFSEVHDRHSRLEREITTLAEQHAKLVKAHNALEEGCREQANLLEAIVRDADRKQDQLNTELGKFEQHFQEAKERRDRSLGRRRITPRSSKASSIALPVT